MRNNLWKKNAHYVGVDEKYIPEDEKYVKESIADDLKTDLKESYQNMDKEKVKKNIKLVAKVWIGYFIGVGIFAILIFGFVIIFIIKVISKF